MELLQKMEEDDNKPFVSEERSKATASASPSAVPNNIAFDIDQFDKGGNSDEEEEDDHINPTLKAACNPALDSGDNSSSSHPSQPSDDSRKVKKTPV